MRNRFRHGLLFLLLLTLSACATFQPNPQLAKFDKAVGYRYQNLAPGKNNTESLYVILAFSGGGTRAAALSYGALAALEKTRITWEGEEKSLLDEVDLISSISGGSFTAGYYALHGKDIFNGDYERDFLKHDVQSDLVKLLFNPVNWVRIASPSFGRSDLAAEYYDQHVFNGATYADIEKRNTRPYVILNATDMTLGSQFSFIQDQFDLMCSDLSKLKVARAATSSSAFPGLLTPLTYQNYAGSCNFVDYPWVARAEADRRINADRANLAANRQTYYELDPAADGRRNFIHLIDGGVADNIGLRGPYNAIATPDSTYSIQQQINNGVIKKLLVIVINAANDPDTARDKTSAAPGVVDNLVTAATVPLNNYSNDTITMLGAKINEYNAGYQSLQACTSEIKNACPATSASSAIKDNPLNAVDFYVTQVAFDFVADATEQLWFKNVGTNFSLPAATIDKLTKVACDLIAIDPQFKRLVSGDAGFTGTRVTGTAPDCK